MSPEPAISIDSRCGCPSRFHALFPILSRAVDRPWPVVAGIGAIGMGLSFAWSPHIGIATSAFAYLLLCLRIERRHLERLALPPLSLLGFNHLLSCGIGLPLYWYGMAYRHHGGGATNQVLLKVQCCHALAFPLLMLGYYLASRRRTPAFALPPLEAGRPARLYRVMSRVGWLLLVDYAVVFIAGWITGGTDRSREAEFLAQARSVWTVFNSLPRLQYIYFLVLPLTYRLAGRIGRFLLLAANAFWLGTFLLSGSRGQLVIPAGLILIGSWMFWELPPWFIRAIKVVAILIIPYVPLIALYRSTGAFMNSRESSFSSRIAAFAGIKSALRAWDVDGLIQVTGESFWGTNDEKIFAATPEDIPYAGWADIGRLKLFWLPTQLAPGKRPLLDGNEIVAYYMNDPTIHGSGITFSADMYRRFGWTGVIAGNLLLGLCLGRFFSLVFGLRLRGQTVWMLVVVLFSLTYITSVPYHTLLSTCWIWLWEFPKHMVAMILLVFVAAALDRSALVNPKGPLSPAVLPS